VPSFSDVRADDLLRAARAAGLQPRSDAELLPLLLDLIGGLIPVGAWPTQMTRQQRTAQAREVAQADQAAADRPTAAACPAAASPRPGAGQAREAGNEGAGNKAEDSHTDTTVAPMRWRDRARDTENAVDAERRRRREQAVAQRPAAPVSLGDRLRRTSFLALPDDDPGTGAGPLQAASEPPAGEERE
jgi:hypothetical protein